MAGFSVKSTHIWKESRNRTFLRTSLPLLQQWGWWRPMGEMKDTPHINTRSTDVALHGSYYSVKCMFRWSPNQNVTHCLFKIDTESSSTLLFKMLMKDVIVRSLEKAAAPRWQHTIPIVWLIHQKGCSEQLYKLNQTQWFSVGFKEHLKQRKTAVCCRDKFCQQHGLQHGRDFPGMVWSGLNSWSAPKHDLLCGMVEWIETGFFVLIKAPQCLFWKYIWRCQRNTFSNSTHLDCNLSLKTGLTCRLPHTSNIQTDIWLVCVHCIQMSEKVRQMIKY